MVYTVLAIGIVAFSVFGAWIAAQKGRSPIEGAIIGLIFGPIGVLVETGLPNADHVASVAPRAKPERPLTKAEIKEMEEDKKASEAVSWLVGK